MDVDGLEGLEHDMVPMPRTGSIAVLKEKLRARVATLRHSGAQNDEPGNRDELLEERRKQRAALREKRRKETKERKRVEAESKKDKGKSKEKEKDSRGKSASIKVRLLTLSVMYLICFLESIARARITRAVFFGTLW